LDTFGRGGRNKSDVGADGMRKPASDADDELAAKSDARDGGGERAIERTKKKERIWMNDE
jgi:hypothetical protein